MTTIYIEETSYDSVEVFKSLVPDGAKLKSIDMNYDTIHGTFDKKEEWPFVADFILKGKTCRIYVRAFTLGYPGAGPRDFSKVLDWLGIPYDEDDIFTKKREKNGFIRLHYA